MKKIQVYEIGLVCVYCGNETSSPCCGEVHHETAYAEENGDMEFILESELTENHEVL